MEKIQPVLEELRNKHHCHTIILYGSRARGDANESSDYDILAVRSTGEAFRDARLWNGIYLDIFVYPESELKEPHEGMLDIREGKILFQEGDFGLHFLSLLEEKFQAGPKKLRTDEIQVLRIWHEKALVRIRAGGMAGNLRRAELLPALLEHLFTATGRWFRGSKAGFRWLQENRPDIFQAFASALEPDAPISAIEHLVSLVNGEIARFSQPAAQLPAEVCKRRPEFYTERLLVRMPEPQDVPAVLRYFTDNADRFAPTDPPKPEDFYTEKYWRERISKMHEAWEAEQALSLFLFQRETHHLVGTASFTQMFRGPFQACYLGYSIGGEFEGRGLMTEALRAALQYVFRDLNFHRIMANHLPENTKSAKVLQKLGFVVEGRGEHYLLINGEWRPHILNALVNADWRRM